MAFHKSNLGSFGEHLMADMNGYVPEESDGPWDFAIDHGSENTHDENGELTEYGIWWEEDRFPEWRDETVQSTKQAEAALREWQENNV